MKENLIFNFAKGFLKKISPKKSAYKKAGLSWWEIRKIRNMPEERLNTVKLLGKEITVLGRAGFLHGLQEIFIDEIYRIELRETPFIIDCGANVGLSIIYLKQLYPKAKITAFEPDEANFQLLEKNIQAFGFQNVLLKKEAAWIANTELSFSAEGSMSSRISESGTTKAKAARLKDYLTAPVDFLKLDIEGAEYEVLKDIRDKLHIISNMFIEYHGIFQQNTQLPEILEIITAAGFSFYIKEAANVYRSPFILSEKTSDHFDVQLNIFCFRTPGQH